MFFKKLFQKDKQKSNKEPITSQSAKDFKSKEKEKEKKKNTKSIVELMDNKFPGSISSRAYQSYILEGPLIDHVRSSHGHKWVENMVFPNGCIYSGEIVSSKKIQGQGVLIKKDGSIFEGNFENGKFRGEGRLIDFEGVVYLGVFVGKYLKNCGKIISNSGKQIYIGEVNRNIPHGKGVETWDNGSKFIGCFNKGRREGYGEFYLYDKSTFKGEFSNHNIEGLGIYSWPDGRLYEGQWVKNKISGVGIYTWSDSRVYKGQFEEGSKKGFGILDNPDGSWYVGFWKDSKKEGCGMQYSQGILINGVWKNGELHETIQLKKTKTKIAEKAKRAIIEELTPKTKEMAKMNLLHNISGILNESRREQMLKQLVYSNHTGSSDEEYIINPQDLVFEETIKSKKRSAKILLSEPVQILQDNEIDISVEEPARKKKSYNKKIDTSIKELSYDENKVSYKKHKETTEEAYQDEKKSSHKKKKKGNKRNPSYYEAEKDSVNLSKQVYITGKNRNIVIEKRKKDRIDVKYDREIDYQDSFKQKPKEESIELNSFKEELKLYTERQVDVLRSSDELELKKRSKSPKQNSKPTQLIMQDSLNSQNIKSSDSPLSDQVFSTTQPQYTVIKPVPFPYHKDNSRFNSKSSSYSSPSKDFTPQTTHLQYSKLSLSIVDTSHKTPEPVLPAFNSLVPSCVPFKQPEVQPKVSTRNPDASFMTYDAEEEKNYQVFKADMHKLLNTNLSSVSSLHDDKLKVQDIESSFDLQFRNFLCDAEDVQFLNDIIQYEAFLTSKQETTKVKLKSQKYIDLKEGTYNRIIEEVKSLNNEPKKTSSLQSIKEHGSLPNVANLKNLPVSVKPSKEDKQYFSSLNNFEHPSLKDKNNPAYLNIDMNSDPTSDSSTLLDKQSQYPPVDSSSYISVPEQKRISHLINLNSQFSDLKNQHLIKPIREEIGPFIYSEPSSFSPLNFVDWYKLSHKVLYKGEVNSNGYLEGRGVMISFDFLYEGYWLDGRMEGLGRVIYSNGDLYEGYWNANLKSGFGVLWSITGDGYVGDWHKGVYDGKGMEVNAAIFYEGDFHKGMKQGKGKIIYRNGDVYDGDLLNGGPHGYGMMIWNDGKGYVGIWEYGEMNKKGIYVTKRVCKLNMDVFNGPGLKSKLLEMAKQTRR